MKSLAAVTGENWRLHIADAKRHAAIAFKVTRALISSAGGPPHESWYDYVDALSPIMTDDMGSFGARFASTFSELVEIIVKAGEYWLVRTAALRNTLVIFR